ncbi:MAG TPA: hypothetical protein PK156_26760, partial [Polyangium sp.]|nr:hypothetical protein [Polyangium sp.]
MVAIYRIRLGTARRKIRASSRVGGGARTLEQVIASLEDSFVLLWRCGARRLLICELERRLMSRAFVGRYHWHWLVLGVLTLGIGA